MKDKQVLQDVCKVPQAEQSSALLSVKNLYKRFGKLEVLKGVQLEVHKGDVLAIIGPSGCGKSTLLRCLNLHWYILLHTIAQRYLAR